MQKMLVYYVILVSLIGNSFGMAFAQELEEEELISCYADLPMPCDLVPARTCQGVCEISAVTIGGVIIGIVNCPAGNDVAIIRNDDDHITLSVDFYFIQIPGDLHGRKERRQVGIRTGCGFRAPCICDRPPGWANWQCIAGNLQEIEWPKHEHFGDNCDLIWVTAQDDSKMTVTWISR
jgi:hypothetical protein